jgi:polyadenylate-binding protein
VQTQGFKNFDPLANVFVRNLAKEVTQNQLYKMFEAFGPIQSAKLQTFPDGGSQGFGYIQFERPEHAAAAIEGLNGTSVQGKSIELALHKKK